MKKYALLLALVYVLILPKIIIEIVGSQTNETIPIPTQITEKETDGEIQITVDTGESVISMGLDTYIAGVLQGEMPASFHKEALKAQAVVTRTYTLRRISDGGKHADSQLCTDANCCQAFSQDPNEPFISAVTQTRDQVLLYENMLIEATYYSCSGGKTEAAVEVWGTDIPYLQAIDSPGEESALHYRETVRFTLEEFAARLGILSSDLVLPVCADVTYTAGGGVKTIVICGNEYTGIQVRSLLGLRSTVFDIELYGEDVLITTKGFGHRVGMSQYGANAMAQSGSDYEQILAYYYPETELKHLDNVELKRIFDKGENFL